MSESERDILVDCFMLLIQDYAPSLGGFGSTNFAHLKHYVVKYRCYILKEIEIINPYIIVCGGTCGTLKALNKKIIDKKYLKDDYHPAYSRHKKPAN